MESKFLKFYNLVMESIDTKRKPIQKVDQMSPREFLKFLKEFLPFVKNGKVDLNEIRITEKIDGNALRLLTENGEMMFESSYSGITTYDKIPMKEAGLFLYNNYSQLFNDIYELIGSDFKLIGELIWIDDMEDSGKVTPVGASYLTEKFGKHGGMVVFDILKIEEDKLVPFENEKETEIFNMIKDLNNEDFSFYLSDSINITKNVTFELNVDELQSLIDNPDFNKERFNKKTDAKILEEIQKIKENVCNQLSKTIDNTKGAFSADGDLIEGIVVKILSNGDQYGMFSSGYKDMKHKYWQKFEDFKKILDEFYKSVFGYNKLQYRRQIKNFNNNYKDLFDNSKEKYVPILTNIINDIKNDKSIPIGIKQINISMAQRDLDNINIDWDKFVQKENENK